LSLLLDVPVVANQALPGHSRVEGKDGILPSKTKLTCFVDSSHARTIAAMVCAASAT
jgi:hypothetical protein